MKLSVGLLIALVFVACWRFPLFHVVSLERATKEKAAATFNPAEFAEEFWNAQLLKSLDKAVKAEWKRMGGGQEEEGERQG